MVLGSVQVECSPARLRPRQKESTMAWGWVQHWCSEESTHPPTPKRAGSGRVDFEHATGLFATVLLCGQLVSARAHGASLPGGRCHRSAAPRVQHTPATARGGM